MMRLHVGPSLLVPDLRRRAAGLLVCCVALVGLLGVLVAHQSDADGFDRAVDAPVIGWFGRHPGLAAWLASPGSLIPAGILSAVIVVGCLVAGRLNGAVLGATAVPAAVGLVEAVLKPLFHRTYLGNVVYPSGHTTAVFAIAATASLLMLGPPRPRSAPALRTGLVAATWALGLIVAAAVIGLRWHYVTDTVAGAATGLGTVCGLALLLDLPTVRTLLARAIRRESTSGPVV